MSDGSGAAGVIVAGGASRRMGRDKATLRLPDGRRMIDAVADALGAVCDRIVVAGGDEGLLPGCPHVRDAAGAGPLAGIEAVLSSGLARRYLVCPCDLPALAPPPLRALLEAPPAAMAVLRLRGERDPRPLPARIDASALPAVRALIDAGDLAVRALVAAVAARIVPGPAGWATMLANVNTPAAYRALGEPPGG